MKSRFSSSQRKEMYFFSLKLVLFFLFILTVLITTGLAFGYKYDLKKQFLFKTSIINLDTEQDIDGRFKVFLDNQMYEFGKLPAQITSIKPGRHDLIVETEGYYPWSKSVIVKEDIVSEYSEILFIPTKNYLQSDVLIHGYLEKVASIDGKAVFYNSDLNYYKMFIFSNDGDYEVRFLENILERPENIEFLNNKYLKFNYSGNRFKFLDLDTDEIFEIDLDDSYGNLIFDDNIEKVYYKIENDLYFAHIKEDNTVENSVLLKQDIITFDVFEEDLVFVSSKDVGIIELPVYENIQYSIYNGYYFDLDPVQDIKRFGESYLLVSSNSSIYLLESSTKEVLEIAENGSSYDLIEDGYLLYSNGYEIVMYDYFNKTFSVITRLATHISDLQFYNDLNHFIFTTKDSVKIVDKDGGNMFTLFDIDPETNVSVVGDLSSLLYQKDSKYYLFSF